MMCTNLHVAGMSEQAPYRKVHENHPCTVWARKSLDNWLWLKSLGMELYAEYQYRYDGKTHKSGEVLKNLPQPASHWFEFNGLTERPMAMPDQYKCSNVVESYRAYYLGEKADILKYTIRPAPSWMNIQ